jgi:class 3 adenylate cyclase
MSAVGTVLIAIAAFVAGLVAGRLIGRARAVEQPRIEAPEVTAREAVPAAAPVEAAVPRVAAYEVETPREPAPPSSPKRKLRETTVLVCDVGSGSSGEDDVPANVLRCVSDLQRILAGIIGDEGGSIDRFAGDRVIAVFSANGWRTDHAGHALEAAQRIANNVDAVSRRLGYDLRIGIGVHSGSLPAGDDGRVDQTAIGDAIDVASRLEALASEAKVSVIVSEDVLDRAEGEASAFEPVGEVALGGGDAPRRIFALKSRDGAVQLDLIDLGSANAARLEITH